MYFLNWYIILVRLLMITCASRQRWPKVNAFWSVKDFIHHISGLDLWSVVDQTKFSDSVISTYFLSLLDFDSIYSNYFGSLIFTRKSQLQWSLAVIRTHYPRLGTQSYLWRAGRHSVVSPNEWLRILFRGSYKLVGTVWLNQLVP